jgi:hypothetical protein
MSAAHVKGTLDDLDLLAACFRLLGKHHKKPLKAVDVPGTDAPHLPAVLPVPGLRLGQGTGPALARFLVEDGQADPVLLFGRVEIVFTPAFRPPEKRTKPEAMT